MAEFPDDGIILPGGVDAPEVEALPLIPPKRELAFEQKFQILASCLQLIQGKPERMTLEKQLFKEVSEFLNFEAAEK